MVRLSLSVVILLTAFFLRMMTLDYAINEVCLIPQNEYWLTESPQATSLYAWNAVGNVTPDYQIAPTPQDRVSLRYIGVLTGLLTIALTLYLLRAMRSRLGWAIVLLIALSPWFVIADRWVVAFDFAPLMIAISVTGLWFLRCRHYSRWIVWLVVFSAMSLLFIAPSLWWIMLGLLLAIPNAPWRKILFAFAVLFVLVPGVRSPLEWFQAIHSWDVGTTAALVWLVLITIAFFYRNVSRHFIVVITIVALLSGVVSLWDGMRLPRPSQEDWNVIRTLQNVISENSTVAMTPSLYPYVDIIRCPMGEDITFTPTVYLPTSKATDGLLTVVEGVPETTKHLQPLDSRYTLIRNVGFVNPMVVPVRDQLVVLNAELLSPLLMPSGILDIRLDMQFTNQLNEQFSVYGLFVHVTLPDQPGEKLLEYGYPIGQEMGTIQKRDMIGNYHVRVALPPTIPVGTYDVIVGFIHNVEVKEMARIIVGRVEVQSP